MAAATRSRGVIVFATALLCALALSLSTTGQQSGGAGAGPKKAQNPLKVIIFERFQDKLRLHWQPVRPDLTHISLTKHPGKLTIITQRGDIHGDEKNDAFGEGMQAKNIYLIDNPLGEGGDFMVTTCVAGFTPAINFQQAGLILYDDDDNYLKWGYEYNWPKGGGQTFVLVRETQAKPDHHHTDAESGLNRYWARIIKRGNTYEYSASTDGKEYTMYGEKTWDGGPKKIGLLAINGGNKDAPETDVPFESFELRSPPPPKRVP